jgi:hypothetical protein
MLDRGAEQLPDLHQHLHEHLHISEEMLRDAAQQLIQRRTAAENGPKPDRQHRHRYLTTTKSNCAE